jgi:hypothetical protein
MATKELTFTYAQTIPTTQYGNVRIEQREVYELEPGEDVGTAYKALRDRVVFRWLEEAKPYLAPQPKV